MKEVVIDPEDSVCEIYVMDGNIFIEQSLKIPLDAIITVTDTPYARIRITVDGDGRETIHSERRASLDEEF